MTCRDCRLFDLSAVKSKSGAVMNSRPARCLWKSKEVRPLSLLNFSVGWLTPNYMRANDGDGCPCFIPLATKDSPSRDA